MKYSLRSLMVGMTLFCVLLGARIEYLRRWANFHSRQADECEANVLKTEDGMEKIEQINAIGYHKTREDRFGAAMYRPWTLV